MIALQADIRIVAEDAKLAIPQARCGMIGDAGSHWTVRRETGYHLLLMGTPDAAEGPRAWMERRDPQWTLRAADVLEGADAVDGGHTA